MSAPAVPPPDDKDWTWILDRQCPDCGFDARAMDRGEVGSWVDRVVGSFAAALTQRSARDRPAPTTWSVLEYACHVRDVCRLFRERVRLMLDTNDPLFANWDQDETAQESAYWTQEPAVVAQELAAAGRAIAATFALVADDEGSRPGRRSNGSVFTVETLGRYFVHDLVHHADDVGYPVV